jgi:hypothetical protein
VAGPDDRHHGEERNARNQLSPLAHCPWCHFHGWISGVFARRGRRQPAPRALRCLKLRETDSNRTARAQSVSRRTSENATNRTFLRVAVAGCPPCGYGKILPLISI